MSRTDSPITSQFVDAGGEAVRAAMRSAAPPERLYHFTTCRGLLGILESKSLWASLATGLGDESEIRYGLARANDLLATGALVADSDFRSKVVHFLNPAHVFHGTPIEFHPYVISLSGRIDLSLHWLHYGYRGTGCALALSTDGLVPKSFELAKVIYDGEDQDKILLSIVDATWQVVLLNGLKESDPLYSVAAHSTALHLRMAAAFLKNPAFSSEEEWRLITNDIATQGRELHVDEVPRRIRFREVSGRIVPYVECNYERLPMAGLVLGASFPMDVSDRGLATLLRETCGLRPSDIMRSDVPVRP
jgi:Protein of unknown function (DUF2971)